MLREQLEAQQNLAKLSQATSYIFEWQTSKLSKGSRTKINKETIAEEGENPQKRTYRKSLSKQISQKYDLKKWESRAAIFNNIQYPILNENLFASEEQYILPKCKLNNDFEQSNSMVLPKRRQDINRQIYKAIEQGIVKKKLDKFKKKIQDLQRNVMVRQISSKIRCFPKRFSNKKQGKSLQPLTNREKQRINEKQIQNFKKMLTKRQRRLSLPNLIKLGGEKLPVLTDHRHHI